MNAGLCHLIRLRVWRAVCFGLLFRGAVALAQPAGNPDATFDAANRLFDQGKYFEAVAGFESILRSGRASPALYFNLGNAYFKLGEAGRALAAYRVAARMAPRDPDIAANLEFVRRSVSGGAPPRPGVLTRLVTRLTLDEWAVLTAASLWLWMGALLWRQQVANPGPASRRLALFGAIATVLIGTLLAFAWAEVNWQRSVVVIAKEAILRHGPLDESPSLQTLRDGQELRVRDEKDDWLLVSGATRGPGWIKRDQVLVIR
ncbi:MAG: tetratricopeptide repeat protein [Verrucomicrobia bacterium]|nr:tetratricopeptide repeat protein [Verrucomicrobiota bacterium]